jgi:hypothetical protein
MAARAAVLYTMRVLFGEMLNLLCSDCQSGESSIESRHASIARGMNDICIATVFVTSRVCQIPADVAITSPRGETILDMQLVRFACLFFLNCCNVRNVR